MYHLPGPPQPGNQALTPVQLYSLFHPLPWSHTGHLLPVCLLSTSCLLFSCACCSLITVWILALRFIPNLSASGRPVDP